MNLLLLILITLSCISSSTCFISRLKNCRYSGNFSVIQEGKYFTLTKDKEKYTETILQKTRSQCTLYCTARDTCLLTNHKKDNSTCELISSTIGTAEDNADWRIVSPEYVTDFRYRGPMCRFIRPKLSHGPAHQYCQDICEAPGFEIKNLMNVAKDKTITSSSVKAPTGPSNNRKFYYKRYMVDGDLSMTNRWFSELEKETWVLIDLATEYGVVIVSIFFAGTKYDLDNVNIKVGMQEDPSKMQFIVQGGTVPLSDMKDFYVQNGPILGRYVYFHRVSTESKTTKIREIKVFVQPRFGRPAS